MDSSSQLIIILGGTLKKDKKGKWRTTHFDESDNFGVMGDRLRIFAGFYLYKENPLSKIIVSGGRGQLSSIKDAPTVAEVMKKELVELGVPEEKIVEEKESGNTCQQLHRIKELIVDKTNNIWFISNQWHLARIRALIRYNSELSLFFTDYRLISAERVVLQHESKKWEKIIKEVYRSQAMRERIELEKAGIQQIKKGTYKYQ